VHDLAASDFAPHQGARRGRPDRPTRRGNEAPLSPRTGRPIRARRVPGNAAKGSGSELPTPRSPLGETTRKKGQTIMSKLVLETEGDKFVVVTRRFEASPDAVYRAHMDPDLIQEWMLGPE